MIADEIRNFCETIFVENIFVADIFVESMLVVPPGIESRGFDESGSCAAIPGMLHDARVAGNRQCPEGWETAQKRDAFPRLPWATRN